MAIRFYDEALAEKIKRWVKDPNMHILKPDETTRLFQMYADKGNDKPIQLPLISISRNKEIEILNTNKQVKTFDGYTIVGNQKTSVPLNVIPVKVGYQLDIYTRGMEEADEYIRNFVFNFINYPKLKVILPYNDVNVEHLSNVRLDSNIQDNSDIREKLFPDQFNRFTISLEVDDAYLFSTPIKENTYIESIGFQVANTDGSIDETSEVYSKS